MLAVLLIYFLMVALFESYVSPLVILLAVPFGLIGVVTVLFVTGTVLSVQSLLGVIFMVGIVVSNTVLMVDFAQNLRIAEGLTPDQAIRKAAALRVKPVVMTAIATFFALLPMSLALERGSEGNAPLGRAVVGGLLAGTVGTLLVVPAYILSWFASGRPRSPIPANPAIGTTVLTRRNRLDHFVSDLESSTAFDLDGPSLLGADRASDGHRELW